VVNDSFKELLVLQHRDDVVAGLETEIERIPAEIGKLEAKIEEEKQWLLKREQTVKDLETRKNALELEVESKQELIARYKTQQLEVKKNDEYRALTAQIEGLEQEIGEIETSELELMEAIDVASLEFSKDRETFNKRIEAQEKLIAECREKLARLESEKGAAHQAYDDQAKVIPEKEMRLFEQLKARIQRRPFMVEVQDQNCGGCHMRVSNDVYKKAKMGELAFCDQCSRLVYFDR
jgi:predicted  nucleic acid-binding Zn-ribbon protein